MKTEEALQYADQWSEGHTFYEGSQGWRFVCAVLAAEVRRLRASPKPLTDEEIEDLYFDKFSMSELKAFARAIEQAHGIGAGE